MPLAVERLRGDQLAAHLRDLAALRIAVFREYPYLYEGDVSYEERYLAGYAEAADSTLVIVRDEGRVVGASTATPLRPHHSEIEAALQAAGYDPAEIYYFGESVLLPAYRGRGLGHQFFDEREAAGREAGFRIACFCAVERPADDPRRPVDYVPHDAFWTKRGYRRHPGITASFRWRDLGDRNESAKTMVFWTRELTP
jgi:GNAT superfamily N-acetyltransferase